MTQVWAVDEVSYVRQTSLFAQVPPQSYNGVLLRRVQGVQDSIAQQLTNLVARNKVK